MGREPEKFGADDDFIPKLLADAQRAAQDISSEFKHEAQVLDLDSVTEIAWNDDGAEGEVDFDVIELTGSAEDQIEIEDFSEEDNSFEKIPEDVASGQMARLLLDTVEGRTALSNELTELSAFLNRFTDDIIEFQGLDRSELNLTETTARSTPGNPGSFTTLHNMIMQNAPSVIQVVSAKDAANMLACVERARTQLTNSATSRLLLIRSKPGYLDRVVGRLTDLRLQVARAKARVTEAQSLINEAIAEQEAQAATLIRLRSRCKQLVQILETELTQLCNRQVQIIGQVLDL